MQWQGILSVLNLFVYLNCVLAWQAEVNTSNITEWTIKEKTNTTRELRYQMNIFSSRNGLNETLRNRNDTTPIHRAKRQSSGKFTDAAKMPQIKLLRVFLHMFANTWAKAYVGGRHPFHEDVPKPAMYLFKHRIGEFFFPPLQEEEALEKKK